MMNPIIKQQLENCRVANVPILSEDMTVIQIPKGSENEVSPYQVNKCYLMALEDYIINPPPDFTLADNWNKGSIPKYKYYLAEISKVVGKMIYISGVGYNMETATSTLDMWEGWIPQKAIKLIKEV